MTESGLVIRERNREQTSLGERHREGIMSGESSRNIVKIESILFQEVASMNHRLLRETLASREETPVMRSAVRVVDLTHTNTLERASIMETPALASTEAM